ncbi:MAG TPA: bifunctional DNA-formamidopyrimidine glycosylase/DNA-(apurinic or apyrimidinic site) lyase [Steroidobacteraceae bacterium]|nr:bifunctional DNA-formamidopyrimidine glycosylase/DNA-(apurinic or apyrimidinic site) lyase [Steroidobacteraceae bacterium]
MPELPEVETTRRGIRGAMRGRQVAALVLREPRLRWRVDPRLPATIAGQRVRDVRRRAKYLIIDLDAGSLILHLGMSGSLRVLDPATPLEPHDHYDLLLESGRCLRFNDPRRFGSLHWSEGDPADHPLLAALGPEPLTSAFNADYLARRARGRRVAIKQFLMDQRVVVGVGNIYASEALYRAGVHPRRAAGRVSGARLAALVEAIRAVLGDAIRAGGTTLRDYVGADGTPGYFRQRLYVYERAGRPCRRCRTPVRHLVQGQRSTYYCPRCQR